MDNEQLAMTKIPCNDRNIPFCWIKSSDFLSESLVVDVYTATGEGLSRGFQGALGTAALLPGARSTHLNGGRNSN